MAPSFDFARLAARVASGTGLESVDQAIYKLSQNAATMPAQDRQAVLGDLSKICNGLSALLESMTKSFGDDPSTEEMTQAQGLKELAKLLSGAGDDAAGLASEERFLAK